MIHVIGGGLAGSEAAWQAAQRGVRVTIHEMRPVKGTDVHHTAHLAELVCSNSFRSDKLDNAVGLLKEEMRRLGSLVMRVADRVRVPAGAALAVDRHRFAEEITREIGGHPLITLLREEVASLSRFDSDGAPVIVATGPLTSPALSEQVAALVGQSHLYFYDAVSPIVLSDTIDRSRVFRASRWNRSLASRKAGATPVGEGQGTGVGPGQAAAPGGAGVGPGQAPAPGGTGVGPGQAPAPGGAGVGPGQAPAPGGAGVGLGFCPAEAACGMDDGDGDYLNCPFTEAEYRAFYEAVTGAEVADVHDFEKEKFFEGCLPIEVMAHRGEDTLRFGPLKPVGLRDPRTGRPPYAVLQLRQDNLAADHYSLVGCQTQLKWGEQARVFRLVPGLEQAEFVRFGLVHRNTYINSPTVLTATWQLRARPTLFFAGQVSGVEGYVESAASGLLAGVNAAKLVQGQPLAVPSRATAIGALAYYVSHADARHYQPSNITFGIMAPLEQADRRLRRDRKARNEALSDRALREVEAWRRQA